MKDYCNLCPMEPVCELAPGTENCPRRSVRGGARPGAGRPRGDRYIAVTVRLSPEAVEILAKKPNKSKYLDQLIKLSSEDYWNS